MIMMRAFLEAHPFAVGLLAAVLGVVLILAVAFWYFEHGDGPPDARGGALMAVWPLSFLWILACFLWAVWR